MVKLLHRNMFSQQARFERYTASLLHIMAAGEKIDTDRTEKFVNQVDEIYQNPFEIRGKKSEQMTAAEIREYTLRKIRELKGKQNGSSESGCENNPG